MSHQLTSNKTKPVPNGKMAKIMTHCQSELPTSKVDAGIPFHVQSVLLIRDSLNLLHPIDG